MNESQLTFTVTPNGVRFGLTAIKNVGEGAIQSLLDVRTKQGPITSLHALCEDLDLRLVNKRVFESLVKAGAFDSLARHDPALSSLPSTALRPRLLAAIDPACEQGARHQRDKNEGQAQLFGAWGDAAAGHCPGAQTRASLPEAAPWTDAERLAFEKETLGLYWSGHPVDRYASDLKQFGARPTGELADLPASGSRGDARGTGGSTSIESETSIGGIVAACRQLKTRKGDRMAVFTLEDAQGGVEVVAFPEAYQRAAALIETGTMVLVRGKLERDDEVLRLLASEIAPLDGVRERLAREVAIRLKSPADRGVFEALGEIFSRHRGEGRVSFEIELPVDSRRLRVKADVSSQILVRPSSSLIAEVEQVVGQGSVSLR
jgi:DNA polymerase-3 subunit alpha